MGAVALIGIALGFAAAAILAFELLGRREARRASEKAGRRLRGAGAGAASRDARGRDPAGPHALRLPFKRRDAGRAPVESSLPELIDAVCLGLEGGMTFEAAFHLYASRFDSDLARACLPAAELMTSGLEGREAARGRLADELGSKPFRRFCELSARSIRFGAPLAPVLAELAEEVRESNRAAREERVAKAPTKMLVPTGLLILPAMLVLVAGPFIVQLLEQL